MRTIKELLQLTLDEGNKLHLTPKGQRKFRFTGLCGFVLFYIYHEDIDLINGKEFDVLYKFIEDNKPKTPISNKFYGTIDYHIGYYWPSGKWAPRKKWLIDQIKNIK
jgi:hypothetical protein